MINGNIKSDSQIVYNGAESLQIISSIARENEFRRAMIVSGRNSWDSNGLEAKLHDLLPGVDSMRFYDFSPNPKVDDAVKAVAARESFNPDVIITVGGGSVLDMAKLCIALPSQYESACRVIRGEQDVHVASVPLIAIPTTAGSGSEATHFAVVYINKKKYSLAASKMLPSTVILDPELTQSMSRSLAIASAWDAFSQSIESLWARNATEDSRRYASDALTTIKDLLPSIYDHPTKSERSRMLEASHLAGKAINISKTTAPHALSYAFTSQYGLSHGYAVVLHLSPIFRYHVETLEHSTSDSPDLLSLAAAMNEIAGILECSSPRDAERFVTRLLARSGLALHPKELGVASESELLSLLDSVNLERLKNHPIELDIDTLRLLYNRMWNYQLDFC